MDEAIKSIISQTGLMGAVAILFMYLSWRFENKACEAIKEKDEKIAKIEKEKEEKIAKIEKDRDERFAKLEQERNQTFEARIKDAEKYRDELVRLKDAEIARQSRQTEMYHEFEKTMDELAGLLERKLDDDDKRRGR